jgi:hypothetical protein
MADPYNPLKGLMGGIPPTEGARAYPGGASRGIEINESYKPDGTLTAETSGGKQVVRIVEMPPHTMKGGYTNPKTYYRTTKSGGTSGVTPSVKKEPDIYIPRMYHVIHDKGSSATPDYDEAVRLAIHHSRREPK